MELRIQNLSARYGAADVLTEITAHLSSGELLSVVGPSGSGKSTLLRSLAGLFPPQTGGEIFFGSENVTDKPAQARNVGFVFQDLALYSHLKVYDNIALGLRFAKRMNGTEIKNRVAEVADRLEISDLLNKPPRELSGGQQRRVAIARAIVRQPNLNLLLLDEPFSGLDPVLRNSVRSLIRSLHRELRVTTVCVTHDRDDAFTISDRILVLQSGRLQQMDAPELLLDKPANRFVASFTAGHPLNEFPAQLRRDTNTVLEFGGFQVDIPSNSNNGTERRISSIGIRPEAVLLTGQCRDADEAHAHALQLQLREHELHGDQVLLRLQMPNEKELLMAISRRLMPVESQLKVCIRISDIFAFDEAGDRFDLT